ncbi:unnamed protein product [Macrosiphum euphorbiae]|uniref:Uncharacterized protein n=1 Tax=Macrosiphum euphorbiae TaxID=13131 RepID=A0AAV0WSF2_9HEMI|nr:unnamed protein product [Macrosiphum euphorbiae]
MTPYQDKISRTNLTNTGAGMFLHSKLKRPFLGQPPPAINVITQNIEGFSVTKGDLLASLCKSQSCDVLCVQETHQDEASIIPKIPGMNLVIELPHSQHTSDH